MLLFFSQREMWKFLCFSREPRGLLCVCALKTCIPVYCPLVYNQSWSHISFQWPPHALECNLEVYLVGKTCVCIPSHPHMLHYRSVCRQSVPSGSCPSTNISCTAPQSHVLSPICYYFVSSAQFSKYKYRRWNKNTPATVLLKFIF